MAVITDVSPQVRRPSRVSVYLDEEFWCGMPAVVAGELQLRIGDEVDEERRAHIESEVARNAALGSIGNFLGQRARSEHEVRAKLVDLGYSEGVVEETVALAREYGWIDDEDFVRMAIAGQRDKGRARRMAQFKLREYGLSAEQIADGLDVHYPEELEWEVAMEFARSRYRPDDKAEAKLQRQLAARGFGWDVIRETIGQLRQDSGVDD